MQQHSKTTRVGTEAQKLDVKHLQPETRGRMKPILPSHQRRETGESKDPQVVDSHKEATSHATTKPEDDEVMTHESQGPTAGVR
jgi:hypothetical protein